MMTDTLHQDTLLLSDGVMVPVVKFSSLTAGLARADHDSSSSSSSKLMDIPSDLVKLISEYCTHTVFKQRIEGFVEQFRLLWFESQSDSVPVSDKLPRRLFKEIYNIPEMYPVSTHDPESESVAEIIVDEANFQHFILMILIGNDHKYYANSLLKLDILLSDDYPYSPPKVKVIDKETFHPLISQKDGELCCDVLTDEWRPFFTLFTLSFHLLKTVISTDWKFCDSGSMLNETAYQLWRDHPEHFLTKAKASVAPHSTL